MNIPLYILGRLIQEDTVRNQRLDSDSYIQEIIDDFEDYQEFKASIAPIVSDTKDVREFLFELQERYQDEYPYFKKMVIPILTLTEDSYSIN